MDTRTYKIGLNKGRPRIWIDGKPLIEAGFKGGTLYSYAVELGKIVLHLEKKEGLPVRKVTGRPDGKPIVDLLGRDVETAFPGASRVKATFRAGRVAIVVDSNQEGDEK